MAAKYASDLLVVGGASAGGRGGRIGGGAGGGVAVAGDRHWGGACVNVGCVPKKIMVNAAEYGMWAEDAAAFGWDVRKGPHDWAKLIAARDWEVERLSGGYRKLLETAGATVFEAHARFLDPHKIGRAHV